MIKTKINGKTRIIKNIRTDDGEYFEATYRGWSISIYPMWGKLVRGVYRDDLKTGEFGVDVFNDGGKIVDAVVPNRDKGIEMALENILL